MVGPYATMKASKQKARVNHPDLSNAKFRQLALRKD